MTSHHDQYKMNSLHLFSYDTCNSLINLVVDEKIENDIKIYLPTNLGSSGHYLQANGEWNEFYSPLSNEDNIVKNHKTIKHYRLERHCVTFVKAIVEINNSIAILYCNSLGELILIKSNVEYLIASSSNTNWATILIGSTGNLLIGQVTNGNLYHHYYYKGKFYEVPIDMTNDNERFISHLLPNGYPCYLYTRYSGNFDEVAMCYSSDVNGQYEWSTIVINTRPSFTSEYFRSYSLMNVYNKIYMAESCKDKYFAISSCDDIMLGNWQKDIVYDTGYTNYITYNDGNDFIVQNVVYSKENEWKAVSFISQDNILDILGNNIILTEDGFIEYNGNVIKLTDHPIIYGSLTLLPNGQILVLLITDPDWINIYRING